VDALTQRLGWLKLHIKLVMWIH